MRAAWRGSNLCPRSTKSLPLVSSCSLSLATHAYHDIVNVQRSASAALLGGDRSHARPQIVELEAVGERRCRDHRAVAQLEKPGVGVRVRLAVARRASCVEEHDDRIAVRANTSDRRLERFTHACIEWPYEVPHERFLVFVGL